MLRETIASNASVVLAVGGLLIGLVFGAVVYRTNYCAMGSLSDIYNFNDYRRFRAWILAAATALLGTQLLHSAGVVALERSMYLASSFNWFGHIAGGFIFGIGMVFAGGCPSRNLARAGGGDLRSLLTLIVLGVVAYMTIAGLIAPVRATVEGATAFSLGASGQGVSDLLSALTGASRGTVRWVMTVLIAAPVLAFCFVDHRFRNSPVHVVSGVARRADGRGRLGRHWAGLRRHGDAPGAADLAHLYPADGRHAAMAGAVYRHARRRVSGWRACLGHCWAPLQPPWRWGAFVFRPSPTRMTPCAI